jgi:hypothetical protein
VETCRLGADGCTDLVSTACPAGESCELQAGVPTCVPGCQDECLVGDYPACNADAIDTCEMQADGCTDLVSTACPAGESCELVAGVPTCVATCSDECLVGDYPACNADAIDTCEMQADGCYDLVSTACPAGETCELQAGVPTCVVAPPPGDTCSDAILLEPIIQSLTGDTTLANDTIGRSAPDLWYRFTLDELTDVDILMEAGFDTYLWLYDGVCGSVSLIAQNDDCGGSMISSCITRRLSAGTYFVVAEGYGAANFGPFELTLDFAAVP